MGRVLYHIIYVLHLIGEHHEDLFSWAELLADGFLGMQERRLFLVKVFAKIVRTVRRWNERRRARIRNNARADYKVVHGPVEVCTVPPLCVLCPLQLSQSADRVCRGDELQQVCNAEQPQSLDYILWYYSLLNLDVKYIKPSMTTKHLELKSYPLPRLCLGCVYPGRQKLGGSTNIFGRSGPLAVSSVASRLHRRREVLSRRQTCIFFVIAVAVVVAAAVVPMCLVPRHSLSLIYVSVKIVIRRRVSLD